MVPTLEEPVACPAPTGDSGQQRSLERNDKPGNSLHHQTPPLMLTWRTMETMSVRCPTDRRNGRTCSPQKATECFIPASSSRMYTPIIPNMLVAIGNHRTRQNAHGLRVQVLTSDECLPSPSMLRLFKRAAPPQRGRPFCPLPLPLLMRLFIPMSHLQHLCRLATDHAMWLWGSGRPVKPFMLKLLVRRVPPSKWTTPNQR